MPNFKPFQFSVKAALGLMLAIALAFGVYRVFYPWRPTVDYERIARELKSITIRSADELDLAAKHDYLVLFVDADWSPTTKQSSVVFIALKEKLKSHSNADRMAFCSLDCTEQDADPFWEDYKSWLVRHGVDPTVMTSGSGTIVLAKSGKVASLIWCPSAEKFDEVLATTYRSLDLSN